MFREMRRIKQQLPPQECEEVLASRPRGVLAVLGDGGYPYTVPLDYVFDQGRIYFHGAGEGHKMDALAACNKASFCVLDEGVRHDGEWWLTFRSVVAFGHVSVVEDDARRTEVLTLMGEKYFPPEKDVSASVASSIARTTILELTIDHMTGKLVREK